VRRRGVSTIYGRNAILGEREPMKAMPAHELGIVVQGVAPTKAMAEEVCMIATRQMFYARLPQVKGTAGGVAFLLDEVMPASPAYRGTLNPRCGSTIRSNCFRPSLSRPGYDGALQIVRDCQDDPQQERRRRQNYLRHSL
jgi:hypothetical protein